MSNLPPTAGLLARALRDVGRRLGRDFHEVQRLQNAPLSARRFALRAQARLHDALLEALPQGMVNARTLSPLLPEPETSGADAAHLATLILHPLEGMDDFARGLDGFACALAWRDPGSHDAAAVYDPINDEIFAAQGVGLAYYNRERAHLAPEREKNDPQARVALYPPQHYAPIPDLGAVAMPCASANLALARLSAGRIDLFAGRALAPWDFGPGLILARASGAMAQNPTPANPEEGRTLVCARPERLDEATLTLANARFFG